MENQKNRSGWWTIWCIVALTVFVIYPLSVGPAKWLVERGLVSAQVKSVLAAFYWPLECTLDRIPESAEHAFMAYVNWWS
jgi:hypothetical protein